MEVLGLDAYRKGWVGVVLTNGRFARAPADTGAESVVWSCAPKAVGVDIPREPRPSAAGRVTCISWSGVGRRS